MKFSTKNILQKATKIFFVLSLVMIAFSVIDLFLRRFKDIQITLRYEWIWLGIILITLLFLGLIRKWKRFLLIMFLGFTVVISFFYFLISSPLSVTKAIENSRYDLLATPNEYKIYEKKYFYKVLIASKKSRLFSKSNVKTGLNYSFEVRKVSETSEIIILEIKAPEIIKDTVQKSQ